MPEWDWVAMLLVSGGVALYTGYGGWQAWGKQQKGAAAGAFLLALLTLVLPIVLMMVGG